MSCITAIFNGSVVNAKQAASVAHEIGKLTAEPSIVSVTDSSMAFWSIFITKKNYRNTYIYDTTADKLKGGSFGDFQRVKLKRERE